MEYGDDPRYFTRGLPGPVQATLEKVVTSQPAAAVMFLSEHNWLGQVQGLFEVEVDERVEGEQSEITQFEFTIITRHLCAYADYLGVYTPHIWELYCLLTENPRAPITEQIPASEIKPEVERVRCLAEGEFLRLFDANRTANGTPPPPVEERFNPPVCPTCSGADTFVASSPARFRRLCCRRCGHRWKLAK